MGFFSSILKVVAPIAGAFLGVQAAQPAAIAAPAVSPAASTAIATIGRRAPTAIAGIPGAGRLGTGLITPALARRAAVTGVLGPISSGRMRKRTTVETFDPVTGVVSKSISFAGGVAVRAADVAAARRVFRQIRKLDGKLPRKTVKQSPVKALTDRVIKNALERAGDDNGCPPKSC